MNFGQQTAEFSLCILTSCHDCQSHMGIAEGESIKLCHVFGSGLNFKMHVQNWGLPPLKRGPKMPILGWFSTISLLSAIRSQMPALLCVWFQSVCLCVDVTHDVTDTAQQLSSTTTSTSTVNCSPRWIVYHNTNAEGASRIKPGETQQQCLDACVVRSSCVAVDWNYGTNRCFMHDGRPRRQPHSTVIHFEIARRCNATSGRL